MVPQFMHVKQIAAKDTIIAEKNAALTKQEDTLTVQELTIKRLTANNEALKAAHALELQALKQKDNLTVQDLTIASLKADIEDLKAAYEEEIETLRQRWEKEANQCQCQREGHAECQDSGWGGYACRKRAVKLER
jgi:hypothetical protein